MLCALCACCGGSMSTGDPAAARMLSKAVPGDDIAGDCNDDTPVATCASARSSAPSSMHGAMTGGLAASAGPGLPQMDACCVGMAGSWRGARAAWQR